MKLNLKKPALIAIVFLVLGASFGLGFYVASEKAGVMISSRASAAEKADLNTFWKVWEILDNKYVSVKDKEEKDSAEKRMEGAIKGMVESLGDPYTTYFDEKELESFESSINGSFEGVGMEIGIKDDLLKVVAPIKNSPAEKAGIKAGDIIVSINGTSTKSISIEKAVSLIRGKSGTEVVLTITKASGETIEVSLIRAKIEIPNIETKVEDGVFVITVNSFSSQAPNKFREALKEFMTRRERSLVIDLRGNPGGYLEAAVDIASWFLPVGKVIAIEDFGEGKEEKIFRSKGYNVIDDKYRVAILVDKGSASASEILAGALRDHKVAVIVGEKTFGKGSVQELISVTSDTSLKVTVARWLTPNGESISDGGLEPDILVDIDAEREDKTGKDKALEKAIEAVR